LSARTINERSFNGILEIFESLFLLAFNGDCDDVDILPKLGAQEHPNGINFALAPFNSLGYSFSLSFSLREN